MLTLADITAPDGYKRAPQVARDDVRFLWHVDYWDGPRSGVLEYSGERCWFQVIAENEEDAPQCYRHFAIIRMSAEQLADEQRWHELFRQHVGSHTDYDETGRARTSGDVRPREQAHHFYDAYAHRTPPDFSGNEVLGWFEY